MPRSLNDNAYYEDERGSKVPDSNLFRNKFKETNSGCVNVNQDLKNFLDPAVRPLQRQKQSIPTASQNHKSRYDFFAGSKVKKKVEDARKAGGKLPELKVSLLFGVEQDLDNLGLRYYFEQVDDRVLINIPGSEEPRWNFGISGLIDQSRGIDENQIKNLIAAGLGNVPQKITILAAYSTGYGGLNQTVNEGLIPLGDIETAVYYDCTYRADIPVPARDDSPVNLSVAETNAGPDELDRGHANSAFNTQRARKRVLDATGQKAAIVAYMATMAGSPIYLRSSIGDRFQYTADFPVKMDLRRPVPGFPVSSEESLFALILTRWLAYAQVDAQVALNEVPVPFRELAKVMPQRGQIASTSATLKAKPGFRPTTTLLDWGAANKVLVKAARGQVGAAIALISDRKLIYSSGYPSRNNPFGALHASLLPEFGWEYLL